MQPKGWRLSGVPTLSRGLSPGEVAALSKGTSDSSILGAVSRTLARRCGLIKRLVDVGCGAGDLFRAVGATTDSYTGVDLVRYGPFPSDARVRFVKADLNGRIPVDDDSADAVVSVETIEHLENPRAFVRELVRIVCRGGLVLITTPNQLSLLSKLTLVTKGRFNSFQEAHYPAHITALLEADLRHIALESGLEAVEVEFTNSGRIPGTALHWPHALGLRGRPFSDNLVVSGLVPH